MDKQFEYKLNECYKSIEEFTTNFLEKQELMNGVLTQRFKEQLDVAPPFLLKNVYMAQTVENFGKLVSYIKPLYPKKIVVIADQLEKMIIFKKHQCKLNEEKFELNLNLELMKGLLIEKRRIMQDFFENFRNLKANYKEYLTQLDIFKWETLEAQIGEIDQEIAEKDLVNLLSFIEIIIGILETLEKKENGQKLYYYSEE